MPTNTSLRPNRIGYQPEALENLPAEWSFVNIGDIATVRAGNGFPHKYQGNRSGTFPFFKVSDMNLPGNHVWMSAANHWVDAHIVKAIKGKPFPVNTIVFPKVGAAVHTNKKRLLAVPGLVDNNVMGVTVTELTSCLPEYLFYWFCFINISEISNPGPLPSITASSVKSAQVPVPPLQVQEKIVVAMRILEQGADVARRKLQSLVSLKNSVLHDILTGNLPNIQSLLTDDVSETLSCL